MKYCDIFEWALSTVFALLQSNSCVYELIDQFLLHFQYLHIYFFSWTNDGQYIAVGLFSGLITIRNKVRNFFFQTDSEYNRLFNSQMTLQWVRTVLSKFLNLPTMFSRHLSICPCVSDSFQKYWKFEHLI